MEPGDPHFVRAAGGWNGKGQPCWSSANTITIRSPPQVWRSAAYLAAGGALDLHDDRLKVTLAEAFLTEEKPERVGD